MIWLTLPREEMEYAGEPSFVVNRTVAHDLEILRGMPRLRRCVLDRVQHAHPIHRSLLDAVDDFRLGKPCSFENSGGDVGYVVELCPDGGVRLEASGPSHHHRVSGATKVGGNLLHPAEWRCRGMCPAGCHVRVGLCAPQLIKMREIVFDGRRDAVEVRQLVVETDHAALGAGAVVADDRDHQCVVGVRERIDRIDEPPEVLVRMLPKGGPDLSLACE